MKEKGRKGQESKGVCSPNSPYILERLAMNKECSFPVHKATSPLISESKLPPKARRKTLSSALGFPSKDAQSHPHRPAQNDREMCQ